MTSFALRATSVALAAAGALVVGMAFAQGEGTKLVTGSTDAAVVQELRDSFRASGIAQLDRIDQSELQKLCTQYAVKPMPAKIAERLQKAELANVKAPADGKYLGDWKEGEKVAQNGRGMQFTDKADTVNGGNCYACHQLTKSEISFGNIGPSLYHYGKLRGDSPEVVKYTWAKVYDSHSYMACSNMPRFGAAGILTEQQLKDVMALLLDPASPVNQ
ncbi:sulfur oxidation c-type cytochrome SoxX [Pandoraea apista]|uniref:SoxX protein n=1 Tax=Pandoraea apista TaxID=93218 RepID=A0A5E5NXY8_9BURK|nr:sulfur oxidation c-type cytochrome SoxX [Pandoraea apista]AJE98127.1 SoxX protein [Pandoraea apista]AKH72139.1 SoxX protein [Pandoraea apista]AKI60570.1 SoxX protein [Pandoraea apista]AVF38710.1 sulfur oxidation c-type cytochrome SoxX [Pandoraea apista]OXS94809.1 sulfur oxidation c-type cytochrome SoxX [Pandoraea apista]